MQELLSSVDWFFFKFVLQLDCIQPTISDVYECIACNLKLASIANPALHYIENERQRLFAYVNAVRRQEHLSGAVHIDRLHACLGLGGLYI